MKHILKSASSVALILAGVIATCLLLKVGSDLVFGNAAGWKAWVSLGALFFIAESIAAARSDSAARRRPARAAGLRGEAAGIAAPLSSRTLIPAMALRRK